MVIYLLYFVKQYPTITEAIGSLMKVILDAQQLNAAIRDMVSSIIEQTPANAQLAVIGIRSRGEILAGRLCKLLSAKLNKAIPCGTLDITLYRDDLNSPQGAETPQVRATEIEFDINECLIVLVDDVLYTGRSTRAAMDALIDLGRPKAVRLAVLVDRAGREFPIQPDFAGVKTDVKPGKLVQVHLVESDGKDEVVEE
jgi:pyrimidine operon attenuation protein/uracil phosphoribosyltransferase